MEAESIELKVSSSSNSLAVEHALSSGASSARQSLRMVTEEDQELEVLAEFRSREMEWLFRCVGVLPLPINNPLKYTNMVLCFFAGFWFYCMKVAGSQYAYKTAEPIAWAVGLLLGFVCYAQLIRILLVLRFPQEVATFLLKQTQHLKPEKLPLVLQAMDQQVSHHFRATTMFVLIIWLLFNGSRIGALVDGELPADFENPVDRYLHERLGRVYNAWLLIGGFVVISAQIAFAFLPSLVYNLLTERLHLLEHDAGSPIDLTVWYAHIREHEQKARWLFGMPYAVGAGVSLVFAVVYGVILVDSSGRHPTTVTFALPTCVCFFFSVAYALSSRFQRYSNTINDLINDARRSEPTFGRAPSADFRAKTSDASLPVSANHSRTHSRQSSVNSLIDGRTRGATVSIQRRVSLKDDSEDVRSRRATVSIREQQQQQAPVKPEPNAEVATERPLTTPEDLQAARDEWVQGEQNRSHQLLNLRKTMYRRNQAIEKPSVVQIGKFYARYLLQVSVTAFCLVALVMYRTFSAYPTCVTIRLRDYDFPEFIDECTDWRRSLRIVDATLLGYAVVMVAPAYLCWILAGWRRAREVVCALVLLNLVVSLMIMTFALTFSSLAIIKAWTDYFFIVAIIVYCFVGGLYIERKHDLPGFTKIVTVCVAVTAVLSYIQTILILPAYQNVSTDSERLVLVLVVHPAFRLAAKGIYASIVHTMKGVASQLPNMFIFYGLPSLFFTFIARLFLLGIESLEAQIVTSVLYAIFEVVIRSTSVLRLFVWRRLRGMSTEEALEFETHDRTSNFNIQTVYYNSFVEMLSIIFASSFFVLGKWRYGLLDDVSWRIGIAIGVQIFAEVAADLSSLYIESNYLERNMWSLWRKYQSHWVYFKVTFPIAVVSVIYGTSEYIALLNSTNGAGA